MIDFDVRRYDSEAREQTKIALIALEIEAKIRYLPFKGNIQVISTSHVSIDIKEDLPLEMTCAIAGEIEGLLGVEESSFSISLDYFKHRFYYKGITVCIYFFPGTFCQWIEDGPEWEHITRGREKRLVC